MPVAAAYASARKPWRSSASKWSYASMRTGGTPRRRRWGRLPTRCETPSKVVDGARYISSELQVLILLDPKSAIRPDCWGWRFHHRHTYIDTARAAIVAKPRTAMVPLKSGVLPNASGIIDSTAIATRIPPETASRMPATSEDALANKTEPRTAATGVIRLAAHHTETMYRLDLPARCMPAELDNDSGMLARKKPPTIAAVGATLCATAIPRTSPSGTASMMVPVAMA